MKTPRSIDIAVTNRCNLRCRYCSHFSSPTDSGSDLPLRDWQRFFEELGQCAVLEVTLSGGEPFLRPDLKELIKSIARNHMRYSVLSNGTLIDDDLAAFLGATGRCNRVQVSIDGSVPGTHDAFRGQGNFKKAVSGIKLLKKHKVPVAVRVTIHRQNVRDLENIAKLLLDDIGLNDFSTNAASFMGLCRQNKEMVQLQVSERSLAMQTLLKLNKKYNGRISAAAGPLAEAQHWMNMEKARLEKRAMLPGRGYLTGCNGPKKTLAVRAEGTLVPCMQLSHLELGRINRDSVRDIWQNHPELVRLRKREQIQLSAFDFCRDCVYIRYCTGNCPGLAYTLTGNDEHPSPDACLKRFLESGGTLPEQADPAQNA
ncbi:MAG: SynChlorMet cassette radical SAM/SPASM protein ScmE [Desulfobacteraceae bacterium]|nr:MAG: SynChlorMet cassette radical SAM/SPASM protein ScmE [Desulfobacteraceae bacterium]